MDIESIKPLLAIAASLLGAVLIVVTRKSPNVREGCSLTAALLKFLIVATMIPPILDGKTLHMTLFSFLPHASIAFRVDALGLVFATTASFLWVVTTFYSIGYMRALAEKAQTRYYLCFALTLAATIGAAFSANLLTLYLFYEMITFVTYPLVAHKETQEAFAAGNKYVFYLLMSSKFFLLAIVLTYAFSGTLDFQPHGVFPAGASSALLTLTFFLFLFGISKAAIMPLHAWLPAAMIAPAPVSALLHAVAVVNTGVFCILRVIFDVFGVEAMNTLHLGAMTALIASFTIIAASIYAFTRDDLKARLAYSTVSQLSYIVLGGALLTTSGMAGGIMHIANHAFSKITLFFCAGSIYVASHKTKISQLDGIGKKMPWTMAAFTIGALSIIGIPPLAGSVTKEHLIDGAIVAYGLPTQYVMWASLFLNAGYFLPIVYRAFFKPLQPQEDPHPIQEPSLWIVVPLLLCAVISVMLGIYPVLFADLAAQVIR
jgi:multicomponent Na+:H+ antiporter subunit D